MITLITGTPGAGKTLYALNYVKDLAERETRPVFYNGIADLNLPWTEIDKGEDWHQCPTGAIVVIDECQRVFRPRGNGTAVPKHVELLETHRHMGIDLVIITQHSMLIESNVRKLVGRHFHVMRTFGMARATVHEWASVKDNCDKSRSDSIKHSFGYPKESYKWYKSAELHTHKARIPMKLWVFGILPLVLGGIAYGMYSWQMGKLDKARAAELAHASSVDSLPFSASAVGGGSPGVREDPYKWFKDQAPRVVGLPHTAPVYDQLLRPVVAPIPSGCVSTKYRCSCFTSQGTKIPEVSDDLCRGIVENGYFNAYEDRSRAAGGGVADTTRPAKAELITNTDLLPS